MGFVNILEGIFSSVNFLQRYIHQIKDFFDIVISISVGFILARWFSAKWIAFWLSQCNVASCKLIKKCCNFKKWGMKLG